MKCPYCNHASQEHVTEVVRVAQRKAAAGLREATLWADGEFGIDDRANGEQAGYIGALMDVGILAKNESGATLLAELPTE